MGADHYGHSIVVFKKPTSSVDQANLSSTSTAQTHLGLRNYTHYRAKMDIDELSDPDSWFVIETDLKRGIYPTDREIAEKLRGGRPIPKPVREYLADRLSKRIKLPRGRKPVDLFDQLVRYSYWCGRVRRWQRVYKWMKRRGWRAAPRGTPLESALERVSEESGYSIKTLKTWLKRLRVPQIG